MSCFPVGAVSAVLPIPLGAAQSFVSVSSSGQLIVALSQLQMHFFTGSSAAPVHLRSVPVDDCSLDDDPALALLWHPGGGGERFAVVTARRILFYTMRAAVGGAAAVLGGSDGGGTGALRFCDLPRTMRPAAVARVTPGLAVDVAGGDGGAPFFAVTTSCGAVLVVSWSERRVRHTWDAAKVLAETRPPRDAAAEQFADYLTQQLQQRQQEEERRPAPVIVPPGRVKRRLAAPAPSTSASAEPPTDPPRGAVDSADDDLLPTSSFGSSPLSSPAPPPGGTVVERFCFSDGLGLLAFVLSGGTLVVVAVDPSLPAAAADVSFAGRPFTTLPGVAVAALSEQRRLLAVSGPTGTVACRALGGPHGVALSPPLWTGVRALQEMHARLGAVTALRWSSEGDGGGGGDLLAIGFLRAGIAVVHHSGMCLYCSSPAARAGCVALAWTVGPSAAVSLLSVCSPATALGVLSFGRALNTTAGCGTRPTAASPTGGGTPLALTTDAAPLALLCNDRLLVPRPVGTATSGRAASGGAEFAAAAAAGSAGDAAGKRTSGLLPLRPPSEYLADNYPLRFGGVSCTGAWAVCCGARGCATINVLHERKWRIFQNRAHESAVACCADPCWLADAAALALPIRCPRSGKYRVDVLPAAGLDTTSVLASLPLSSAVHSLACCVDDASDTAFLVVATAAGEVLVYRCGHFSGVRMSSGGGSGSDYRADTSAADSPAVLPMRWEPWCAVTSSGNELYCPGSLQADCVVPSTPLRGASVPLVIAVQDRAGAAHVLNLFRCSLADKPRGQFCPVAVSPDDDAATLVRLGAANSTHGVWLVQSRLLADTVAVLVHDGGRGGGGLALHTLRFSPSASEADGQPRLLQRLALPVARPREEEIVLLGVLPRSGTVVVQLEGTWLPDGHQQRLYGHRLLSLVLQGGMPESAGAPGEAAASVSAFAYDPSFFRWLEYLRESGLFVRTMDLFLHSVMNEQPVAGVPALDRKVAVRATLALLRGYAEYYTVVVECLRKVDSSRWHVLLDILGTPLQFFLECIAQRRLAESFHLARVILMDSYVPGDAAASLPPDIRQGVQMLLVDLLRAGRYDAAYELLRFMALLYRQADLPVATATPADRLARLPQRVAREQDGGRHLHVLDAFPALVFVVAGGAAAAEAVAAARGVDANDGGDAHSAVEEGGELSQEGALTLAAMLELFGRVASTLDGVGENLLRGGCLLRLSALLSTFSFSLTHFARQKLRERGVDVVVVFAGLHRELGLVRSGGSVGDSGGGAPHGMWTDAQCSIYGLPRVLATVRALRRAVVHCAEYRLCLDLLMMDVPPTSAEAANDGGGEGSATSYTPDQITSVVERLRDGDAENACYSEYFHFLLSGLS